MQRLSDSNSPASMPAPSKPPDSIVGAASNLPNGQEPGEINSMSSSTDEHTARLPPTKQLGLDPNEIFIAVMGATGSGKTTFINLVSNSSLRIGRGLESCTSSVQVARRFELDGRKITLIDTPGFDDTTKSDNDILKMIAVFLATTYEAGMKLAGVIYFHRISDFRMGGISARNFKMFRQLCGETSLKNVVIATNMWGEVSKEVGEAREAELINKDMFFKPVLDKGAQIVRHDNTLSSAQAILQQILGNRPRPLRIQRELVDEKKEFTQTAAAVELNKELMKQIEKHEKEMREMQEEMKEAIRTKDEETRRELEAESKKLQAEIDRVQEDSRKQVSGYDEERNKMEARIREMQAASETRVAEERSKFETRLREEQSASRAREAGQRSDFEARLREMQSTSEARGAEERNKFETRLREVQSAAEREALLAAEHQRQMHEAHMAHIRAMENDGGGGGGGCIIM